MSLLGNHPVLRQVSVKKCNRSRPTHKTMVMLGGQFSAYKRPHRTLFHHLTFNGVRKMVTISANLWYLYNYDVVVHWRRSIFLVPSGKAGKAFVRELARLYQAYADASALECIALKACSIIQCLLLQKPHAKSKTKKTLSPFGMKTEAMAEW